MASTIAPTRIVSVPASVLMSASKRPGAPAIFSMLAPVMTRIFALACARRAFSATCGVSRSRYGAVEGRSFQAPASQPPSRGDFSTSTTSEPASAASSAALTPVRPPPTTRMTLEISWMFGSGGEVFWTRTMPIWR